MKKLLLIMLMIASTLFAGSDSSENKEDYVKTKLTHKFGAFLKTHNVNGFELNAMRDHIKISTIKGNYYYWLALSESVEEDRFCFPKILWGDWKIMETCKRQMNPEDYINHVSKVMETEIMPTIKKGDKVFDEWRD